MPTFTLDIEITGNAVITIEADSEEEAREKFDRYDDVDESGCVEWSATGIINSIKEEEGYDS